MENYNQPLEETFQKKCLELCNAFLSENADKSTTLEELQIIGGVFHAGFTNGFNLRQVFVDDLKKEITDNNAAWGQSVNDLESKVRSLNEDVELRDMEVKRLSTLLADACIKY